MRTNSNKVISGEGISSLGDKKKSSNATIGYRLADLANRIKGLEASLQKQINEISLELQDENYIYVDTYYEGESHLIFPTLQAAIDKFASLTQDSPNTRAGIIEIINGVTDEAVEINFAMRLVIIQTNYTPLASLTFNPGDERLDLSLIGMANNKFRIAEVNVNRPGGETGDFYFRTERVRIEDLNDPDSGIMDISLEAYDSEIRNIDAPGMIITYKGGTLGEIGATFLVFGGSITGAVCLGLLFDQGTGMFPMTYLLIEAWDIVELAHASGITSSWDRTSFHSMMANNTTLTNVTYTIPATDEYRNDYIETFPTIADLPADGFYDGRAAVVADSGTMYVWSDTRNAWINQTPIIITDPGVPTPAGTFNGQLGYESGNPPVLYIWNATTVAWVAV